MKDNSYFYTVNKKINIMPQLESDLLHYLDSEEKVNECLECSTPTIEGKSFCSEECFRANNY